MGVGMEEEEMNLAGEEMNPAEEEKEKNQVGQIPSSTSTLVGQELQKLGGAEKTQEPVDGEEPASVRDAKTEKTQEPVDAEQPASVGGAEETQEPVFYQASECQEEGHARSHSSAPSSSPLSSPPLSRLTRIRSSSPPTSTTNDPHVLSRSKQLS